MTGWRRDNPRPSSAFWPIETASTCHSSPYPVACTVSRLRVSRPRLCVLCGFLLVLYSSQVVELPPSEHPFFIGAQFHPEFKSRPGRPSPLFLGFVLASAGKQDAFGFETGTTPKKQKKDHS